MTTKQKEQIAVMRNYGCSYNQIANLLELPKSTVASYCQKYHLVLMEDIEKSDNNTTNNHSHHFLLCKECGELFMPKTNRFQEFCSSRCRVNYWRKQKAEQEVKDRLMKELQELNEHSDALNLIMPLRVGMKPIIDDSLEGLDFLPEESDELVRRKRE